MKLVRLIKMCLNKTYSKVQIGKHACDSFPIPNWLKQGNALLPLLFNYAIELGTIDHCGRGARAKKAHPLHIHSFML
jgi:hypothetical protein